jgi:iron complex outermembrane receptor protein
MNPKTSPLFLVVCFAFVIISFVAAVNRADAQPSGATPDVGVIEGRVQSSNTGTYLRNARVRIEEIGAEAVTDEGGFFRITGVRPGAVRVLVSYVGLENAVVPVQVEGNQIRTIEVELKPAGAVVEMERFVVLDRREESARTLALNQQRQSPNIKNVVAFDEYPKGSDDSLSDFIQFIPGVSINYSGRSGMNATVRGLPPEMTTVTVDGAEVASVFSGQSRVTNLLTIPTTNVGTVELTKVPTPDMAANGLGGTINLTTRSGLERSKPLFRYEVSTAFDPQYGLELSDRVGPHSSMTGPPIRPSFDLSYIRPINSNLAITLALANRKNYYGQEDATIVGWNQVAGFQTTVTNLRLAQLVDVYTGSLAVDWKLGKNNVFKAGINYRSRVADQGNHGLQATYGAGATGDDSFTQGTATGVGTMAMSNSWQSLVNSSTQHSLAYTRLGDVWKLDVAGTYSVSRFKYRPEEELGYFGSASISLPNLVLRGEGRTGAGDRAAHLRPATITARDRSGNLVDIHDGGLYSINSATIANQGVLAHKGHFRANAARDLPTPFRSSLKFGASLIEEYQKGYNVGKTYSFRPSVSVPDRRAANYNLLSTEYSRSQDPMYGKQVQWVGPAQLFDLFKARPDYFVLDEVNAHQTLVNNSKKFEERISAGYVRVDARLLQNRLWLVAGGRYERTDDEGTGPLVDPSAQYRKNANGTLARDANNRLIPLTTNPLEVSRLIYRERGTYTKINYDDFYPSLNASYEVRDDLVLRAGYARTIGRPNLQFIIPGVTYSTVTEASTQQTITVINSRLRPWTGENYDLTLESYLIKDGFGSVGAFQKDLKNFFTAEVLPGTTENLAEYGVITTAGGALDYNIVTRGNGGDARVRGLEFSYRQSFGFAGTWGKSLQAFVNYTRSTLDGSRTADFTGFNPRSLSWGLTWARPRYVIKYSSNLQYETQRAPVNASATVLPGTFNYQAQLRRDTFSVEVVVTPRVTVFGSVQDLNTPGGYHFKLLQYAPGTPEYRRPSRIIEWGVSAIFGVKGEF